MKILVFLACFLACASFISTTTDQLSHEPPADSLSVARYNNCLAELGFSKDDVFEMRDIQNDEHLKAEMEEKKRKTGCVIECIMKKIGMMEGSNILEDKIELGFAEVNITPVTEEDRKIGVDCINEVKDITPECEKSFKMLECILKGTYKKHNTKEEHEENEQS